MKTKVIFLAITFITLVSFTSPAILAGGPGKVKVYILAGQSNAVGYNNISQYHGDRQELDARIGKVSDVLFWPGSNARKDFSGRWVNMRAGVSGISGHPPYAEGCFGPELGFAIKMKEQSPGDEIAIIKFAEGATGIARSTDYTDYIPALANFNDKGINWHPPVKGTAAGKLYTDLLTNIKDALSALKKTGKKYEISGFLWMQGEHEAGISRKMAEDYDVILSTFIHSVRKDLGMPELPVVVGEINSHTWAFGDIARKKQAEVCIDDPYITLVKTVDLPRKGVGDKAHFDADGMLVLGERFAYAMSDFSRKQIDEEISFSSLLKELTDRDMIALMPAIPYRLLHASSYDRRSVEKDRDGWYANNDWSNYIRKEVNDGREEYVMIDAEGPGAITRFWAAGHPNQKNHLRFYMDGSDKPFWESEYYRALIGQNNEIGVPLSQRSAEKDTLNTNVGAQPGHNLYAPIPFSKRIKITSDCKPAGADKGFWYNIDYRIYEEGSAVKSFSAETSSLNYELLRATNMQLNDFMALKPSEVHIDGETKLSQTGYSLNTGDSIFLRFKGTAAIRRILISVSAGDMNNAMKNTWLNISFDGLKTVEVPLGFMFGCGDQLLEAGDWYRKIDTDGTMSCFWVMPYRTNAVVSIVNKGSDKISGRLEAATGDWKWNERTLYFNAGFKRVGQMPAKTTLDFNFIDLSDKTGTYAGDILQVYKAFRGWWGEGDEKIYVDGSLFPDHFGTGSEDYYGYAWGHPETFRNVFNGQPIGKANTGTSGTTVNSRVRSLDAIPFRNSLKVDMESWQLYGGTVDYSVACFWYAK